MLKMLCFILTAGFSMAAWAGGWAPIPPDVWAMKEDPAHGVTGAVVLEQRMTFTGTAIKHVLRFRILSEQGKSAVELPAFLPEATGIEGRTVQPDGSVTTFDKAKDFSQKTLTVGQSDREIKVVLPPGVTSNCVVEVQWADLGGGREDQEIPYSLGYSAEWRLGGRFLTKELVVDFWSGFQWAAFVNPGNCKPPEFNQRGRQRTYVFRDVPGLEPSPYTLDALSGRPSVQVWLQPEFLTNYARYDPQDYWRQAAVLFLRPVFWTSFKRGRAYKALAAELLADLPADPGKAAHALLIRLDRRILNQSFATLEEKARLKKNEDLDTIESFNLEETAARGRTNGAGMTKLYLALAEQAGLHPRLAFVKDRSFNVFHFRLPDVRQLEDFLVGIPLGPKVTFWVDPSVRYADPGMIIPEYQGVQALVMDVGDWHPRPESIDALPPEANQTSYRYALAFADGEERISAKAGFRGYPEWRQRRRYLPIAQEEADRQLKETLEKAITDGIVTLAKVQGAWKPESSTGWEAEARREFEARATLRVDPFPGMPEPLWLPTAWPDHRTVPIVMPSLFVHTAESDVRLPAGYALQATAPFDRQNTFGRVAFTVEPKEGAARVTFRVEVRRLAGPAQAEPELRQFLGWVEEAYRRALVLEKP